MVIDPAADRPPVERAPGATIEQVTDDAGLRDWTAVMDASYGWTDVTKADAVISVYRTATRADAPWSPPDRPGRGRGGRLRLPVRGRWPRVRDEHRHGPGAPAALSGQRRDVGAAGRRARSGPPGRDPHCVGADSFVYGGLTVAAVLVTALVFGALHTVDPDIAGSTQAAGLLEQTARSGRPRRTRAGRTKAGPSPMQ